MMIPMILDPDDAPGQNGQGPNQHPTIHSFTFPAENTLRWYDKNPILSKKSSLPFGRFTASFRSVVPPHPASGAFQPCPHLGGRRGLTSGQVLGNAIEDVAAQQKLFGLRSLIRHQVDALDETGVESKDQAPLANHLPANPSLRPFRLDHATLGA